jgi:hypothetical protein
MMVLVVLLWQPIREVHQIFRELNSLKKDVLLLVLISLMLLREILLELLKESGETHDLVTVGPRTSSYLDQSLAHRPKVMRVSLWYSCQVTFEYFLIQPLHILGCERRLESNHFIEDAAERPDIALDVVGLVSPDLRTGIIGRASLSIVQALLVCYLGYIHIAQLCCKIFVQKNVRALEISVHYVQVMHSFQASDDLDEDLPDLLLGKGSLSLLMLCYLLKKITIICIFHHDTKKESVSEI